MTPELHMGIEGGHFMKWLTWPIQGVDGVDPVYMVGEGQTKIGFFYQNWKYDHPDLESMIQAEDSAFVAQVNEADPESYVIDLIGKGTTEPLQYKKTTIFTKVLRADLMYIKRESITLLQLNTYKLGASEGALWRIYLPVMNKYNCVETIYGVDRLIQTEPVMPLEAMA